jgi:hypothetical protein
MMPTTIAEFHDTKRKAMRGYFTYLLGAIMSGNKGRCIEREHVIDTIYSASDDYRENATKDERLRQCIADAVFRSGYFKDYDEG